MTCHREFDQNTTEDYKHALFQCPAVQLIIEHIKRTFFPNLTHSFSITDILVSTNSDKHKLWHTPGLRAHSCANTLAKLLWAHFSPSVFFCCSIFLKTYNSWLENNFWWIKALRNMKKWLKIAQKCLKMAKIHARRKKTVIMNTQFRV